MERSIIEQVQSYGFDVYMRNEHDSYVLFTDGQHIGYLQVDRMGGFTLCTVHKPNNQTGTGFQVARLVPELNEGLLRDCFAHAPYRVSSTELNSIRKYRNIDEYRNSNSFNAEYKLVPTITDKA